MATRWRERNVFFPWERKGGVIGALDRARVHVVTLAALVVVLVVGIVRREQRAAGVRATRVVLAAADAAVRAYRADHEGACPANLGVLVSSGYLVEAPRDAWLHPIRMTCPGRRDPLGFDLASDGPDGVAYGLDRIE